MMPLTSLHRFPLFRLLLAGVIGFLWWRSHSRTDVLTIFLRHGNSHIIAADRGRAVYLWTNISLAQPSYTYDRLAADNDRFTDIRQQLYETAPVPERIAGVWLGSNSSDVMGLPGSKYRMISIPFWQLAILTGLPLLLGLHTFWRRRLWGTPGCCAGCGYDIRFNSGQCPECGRETPAAKMPATEMA